MSLFSQIQCQCEVFTDFPSNPDCCSIVAGYDDDDRQTTQTNQIIFLLLDH